MGTSMRSLDRAFNRMLTISDNEPRKQPKGRKHENQRAPLRPIVLELKSKAWDHLVLPQYPEDFQHVVSQNGFVRFVRDLEGLNGDIIVPLRFLRDKWTTMITEKHAAWICDDISVDEKAIKLTQALDLANKADYNRFRVIKWNDLGVAAQRDVKTTVAIGPTKSQRKAARKAAWMEQNGGCRKMKNKLTNPSGVAKKKAKTKGPGKRGLVKESLASRLQSRVEAIMAMADAPAVPAPSFMTEDTVMEDTAMEM